MDQKFAEKVITTSKKAQQKFQNIEKQQKNLLMSLNKVDHLNQKKNSLVDSIDRTYQKIRSLQTQKKSY